MTDFEKGCYLIRKLALLLNVEVDKEKFYSSINDLPNTFSFSVLDSLVDEKEVNHYTYKGIPEQLIENIKHVRSLI